MANEKNVVEDVEKGHGHKSTPTKIGHFRSVFTQGILTPEIIDHPYKGSGTEDDPYLVNWIPHDPRNPMYYSETKKWALTALVAFATLAVAFVSSAYSGGVKQVVEQFKCSEEVATLGIALFVLGFAIGPLLWAPMSELFGRQVLFFGTYAMLTIFNAGAAGSQNIWTLIILRFLAGAFGSSPLTNAGGVIADMFPAAERGLAMSLFAAAPFLGPVIGPVVGGFVGETIGWRWIEGIMAIFTGFLWILATFFLPETYPPVLLRRRAAALSKLTGKVYESKSDAEQGKVTITQAFKTALLRPWILLFREPIVLLLSIYMAIIYGTLYMMFSAFPIVFQEVRGWSEGVGGLAFMGVAVGMVGAVFYNIIDNKRYVRILDKSEEGFAPPEARIPPVMLGGIAIPIGLFWFAWTNYPSIPWIVPIMATAPFGFGMVLVFLGIMNYLIDAYVIFAASVLAANAVLRSLFGTIFPLFTTYMYQNLGIHWASSIPGFLALLCVPFPFVFYKYGSAIRKKCKFAAEAEAFMRKMRQQAMEEEDESSDVGDGEEKFDESGASEKDDKVGDIPEIPDIDRQREAEMEQEAFDYSYDDEATISATDDVGSKWQPLGGMGGTAALSKKKTNQSTKSGRSLRTTTTGRSFRNYAYDNNPYDIDRVNTRESFGRARTVSRAATLAAEDLARGQPAATTEVARDAAAAAAPPDAATNESRNSTSR